MRSGKRIAAGILAAVMVFSSPRFSADIVYAEEVQTAPENIIGEKSAAQQETDEEGLGEKPGGEEKSAEEPGIEEKPGEKPEGEEKPAEEPEIEEKPEGEEKPEQEPGQGAEEKPDGKEIPGEEEKPEEEDLAQPETPADGEEAGGQDIPAVPESVSENDLQVSGNTLMSVEGQEIWAEVEIESAYQFGGAPSAERAVSSEPGHGLDSMSAYTDEEIMNYLYTQMKARTVSIDVSRYHIANDESRVENLVSGVLNEHPDLYYVDNRFTCGGTAAELKRIDMTYTNARDDAKMQQGINAALATVNESMTDLQKAIALHDYLVVNCEYDYENYLNGSIPRESYEIYGVFANRKAVCQGYALAYKYLLNQLGINCYMVSSNSMNHAWNLIQLDGQYYQVDTTWDDPVWDRIGRVGHTYMLCSDTAFQDSEHNHKDWKVTEGSSVLNYQALDTRYDNAFWSKCTSPMVLSDSDCYYISPDGGTGGQPALMKTSLNTVTTAGTPLQTINRWTVWNGGGWWTGAYSGLFNTENRLYFNDKENIYSVALDGTDQKTVFTPDTSNGYIYGSALCQGKVLYTLHQNADEDGKETVLEADININGMNLANLSAQYTALDGTTIYSTAAGKPKLLIFYSNICGNCKSTIGGLSSQISRFAGVDIYAIETNRQTKDAVVEFQKQYGCNEITFSYDTGSGNANSMWDYAGAAGISGTVSWPVLCYIDANNRLQYVTTSYISADEIYANLEKYCDYVQECQITPPALTTYKVGQTLNLRGGTVTYPSGSGTKTIALAANMVDGFDSSKPGICKVQVSAGGYMSSFETLIVEEPKLTVAVGKKLGETAFPENAYGSYIWQDDTATVLDKAGVYTFAASFVPSNKTKFQTLSDIRVQVTAQMTLGGDTEVAFKTNRFTYNGSEHEPKMVVRASDTVLAEGQDYELSYENNRDAGTATVTVTGIGCYQGSISKNFQIAKALVWIRAKDKNILTGAPAPNISEYEYEVSGLRGMDQLQTPPTISCAVADTAKAGRYDIVLSGADAGANYEIAYENGTLTVAEEYASGTVVFDVQRHGTAPAALIGVRVGRTVEKPADPVAAGYRFDGWYRDAACTKPWDFEADIVQADMTLYAKWLEEGKEDGGFAFQEIGDVYYTGKACKPAVSVYDGGVLLKSGRDYQIKYYNNTDANRGGALKKGNGEGEANFNPSLPYVEIIGKGDYTDKIRDGNKDTVKVNFNILQASIGDGTENTAAGVTLRVSDQLVTAARVQKPFSSIKYVRGMKRDVDFRLRLTAVNARDASGKSLEAGKELAGAEIPRSYEGEFLLTVEGIGNYQGSVQKTVYVTDKAHLIKNTTITLGKNQKNVVFTGRKVELNAAVVNSPDTFTVKYGKTILTPTHDYMVDYRYNDRVGKAELIIRGRGEYVGTKTAAFNIKGKTFSSGTVKVSGITDRVYTGKAWTQNDAVLTYSVKGEEPQTLRYGTDYTISYTKNINRGTATMTFKGVEQEGYSGSFKKTFKIAAADIADEEQVTRGDAMKNMSVLYCKAGVKPAEEIVLTNKNGFVLRSGKDYTLTYTNNKAVAEASAAKPPTVTVRGKGNYAGKFDVTFRIEQKGLKQAYDEGGVRYSTTAVFGDTKKAETYVYKPAVKLMDGKSTLSANKDYEISYRHNTQADLEKYWEAYKEAASKGIAENDGSLQALRPEAVLTAKEGSGYKNDGEIVVPLQIYRTKFVKDKLQISVDPAPAATVYTGRQIAPKVTVRTDEGKELVRGTDYDVSYGTNIKSGKNKGSVTVTGIAPEYGGSVTVKFDIVKKEITY